MLSCDTFVALPPATANGCVIFGKNADRPCDEVQEVVHIASADHPAGAKLQVSLLSLSNLFFATLLSGIACRTAGFPCIA